MAGHLTTQNLGGRKICWKGAWGILSSSRPNVLEYPPTLRFWMDRWSRDQPQPGCLFQRLREAEKRDPGNEVVAYRAQFLVSPASRGTAKSRIPSMYLSLSRFLHRILVKSQIPKIPFQTMSNGVANCRHFGKKNAG